jgi:hypothetical protein
MLNLHTHHAAAAAPGPPHMMMPMAGSPMSPPLGGMSPYAGMSPSSASSPYYHHMAPNMSMHLVQHGYGMLRGPPKRVSKARLFRSTDWHDDPSVCYRPCFTTRGGARAGARRWELHVLCRFCIKLTRQKAGDQATDQDGVHDLPHAAHQGSFDFLSPLFFLLFSFRAIARRAF